MTRLHFVGIGGIGMSGIAEVFLSQGNPVTGSDLVESESTKRLEQLGARIFIGHAAENIRGASAVVISSAVKANNPEVLEAKRLGIPVIRRAEMLGELMRGKTGIAIAGSHGKTTTTSMMATVFTVAGLDPTLVIGGIVESLGGNAKFGRGQCVVAEADESDGSFLHLPTNMVVVTNIDNDHLDHYGNLDAIETAFVDFVANIPLEGLAAVCGEDAGVRRCLSRFSKPVATYGLSSQWDYYADEIRYEGMGSRFRVWRREGPAVKHAFLGEVLLRVPGEHNVLNALAAVAISFRFGIPFEKISTALSEFRGVKRRFEILWQNSATNQALVDDYGHHPTEILATLAAARHFWKGRIITIFQPHRYSRTLHCREEFTNAFKGSDLLLLTDIYPAGEEPIEGVSSASLAQGIGKVMGQPRVRYTGDLEQTRVQLLEEFKEGDLVLCLGAGSVTKLADRLSQSLGLSKSS